MRIAKKDDRFHPSTTKSIGGGPCSIHGGCSTIFLFHSLFFIFYLFFLFLFSLECFLVCFTLGDGLVMLVVVVDVKEGEGEGEA